MPVIGLTGGIASGKSTATALLREAGAAVVDADVLSREVTAPGSEGLDAVVNEFGPTIVAADGSLNREALGAIVFDDPGARTRLEGILHPRIAMASASAIGAALEHAHVVFYDAALLFETGQWKNFPETWLIAADPQQQLARIIKRDGLDESSARKRISAQLPLTEKAALAHRVFWNNGTRAQLKAELEAALATLIPAGNEQSRTEN
jgi:dephospho-CoA kinase